MSAAAIVEARDLDYTFETDAARPVLRQVSFDLHPGEFVVVTGPSGSGKTTLLTLVGALRSLQRGTVTVEGRALGGMTERERARVRRGIGFIFQDHHLFDALTAAETLRLAMRLAPERYRPEDYRQRPAALLDLVGLRDRADAKPAQLSTGQRQRVGVARALTNDPRLVLADEPTAALDRASGDLVLDLLHERIRESSGAVLMVTHDPRIFDRADRVLTLVDGRLEDTAAG